MRFRRVKKNRVDKIGRPIPASACASHAVFGAPPKTFFAWTTNESYSLNKGNGEGAVAGTRGACAPQRGIR